MLLAAAQLFLAAGFAFTSGTDAAFCMTRCNHPPASGTSVWKPGRADWVFGFGDGGRSRRRVLGDRSPTGVPLHRGFLLGRVWIAVEDGRAPKECSGRRALKQLKRLHDMRDAAVWRLVAWWAGMIVLWHIPWEYLQPALKDLSGDAFVGVTAGVHWTFAMLLAAWAAGLGPWLRARFGLSGTLLFSTLFVTILNASLWLAVHHQIMTVVAVALALAEACRGLRPTPAQRCFPGLVKTAKPRC